MWIAQKRGRLKDFPFPSPLTWSLFAQAPGQAQRLWLGSCSVRNVCSDGCVSTPLSHGCPALQGLSSWPHELQVHSYLPSPARYGASPPHPHKTPPVFEDQVPAGNPQPCTEAPSVHQGLSAQPEVVPCPVSSGSARSLPQDCVPLCSAAGHGQGKGVLGWCLVAGRSFSHQGCQRLLLADHGSSLPGT